MSNDAAALLALALLGSSGRKGTGARVYNRERAEGVRSELQDLLLAWEQYGTHDVQIATNGGLRTSQAVQAQLAAEGGSNATSLRQTPHGRGAALDVWPVGFERYVNGTWQAVPEELRAQFEAFGAFAEGRGFVWGGRWRSAKFPNGDQPHVEIRGWQSLPYPPTQTQGVTNMATPLGGVIALGGSQLVDPVQAKAIGDAWATTALQQRSVSSEPRQVDVARSDYTAPYNSLAVAPSGINDGVPTAYGRVFAEGRGLTNSALSGSFQVTIIAAQNGVRALVTAPAGTTITGGSVRFWTQDPSNPLRWSLTSVEEVLATGVNSVATSDQFTTVGAQ